MATAAERWEQGSDFHWPRFEPVPAPAAYPWAGGRLLGCGRDALRALAEHGHRARGWRRLHVPSYLCQEVVRSLVGAGPEVLLYPDSPLAREPSLPALGPGDALLHVGYFGLRGALADPLGAGCELVEDHTHDPVSAWAFGSRADFCVASLRKTLPIPAGGALWSPRAHPLPRRPAVRPRRERASQHRLAAMVLKALYLGGHPVEKDDFRRLYLSAEALVAEGPPSALPEPTPALLASFPVAAWRARRAENHAEVAAALEGLPWVSVLAPREPAAVPFSAVLLFDSAERRERVRGRLISQRVYPAVLWPLEETVLPVPRADVELSRRVLSLHCDFRYSREEMLRVARLVRTAGEE